MVLSVITAIFKNVYYNGNKKKPSGSFSQLCGQ
nr:MAG TPA: hypothetical protein [Caudoviricetes sp.]